ncbi:MAG: ATP-binding protein [Xanthomonadales bacterium]|nr:ATP-binding protein [Xanthomonadales bacterium]
MARRASLIRWLSAGLVALTLVALTVAGLNLANDATVGRARLGPYYPALLAVAGVLAASLALVIGLQCHRLLRAWRQRQPGARLNVRLFVLFAALSLLPALLVFGFGLNFLFGAVDSRFSAPVGQALDDALEVGRLYLEERVQDSEAAIASLARRLAVAERDNWPALIDGAIDELGALQLTVFAADGSSLANASADPDWLRPEAPVERQRLRLQAGTSGALAVAETRDERLVLRALARIDASLLPGASPLLQAVFPVPDRYAPLAQRIENAVVNYQQLEYLRDWLKLSMTLILGLVLLLVALAALLLALRASRRLVLPLVHLATAAGEIGRGRYQPVPTLAAGDDELGDLVQAFNHMTRELRGAQASVRQNQAMLEGQRAYLDAVLARISSAVIGFDRHGRVRLANPGSESLLQVAAADLIGHDVDQLRIQQPQLAPFLDRLQDHLRHAGAPWHEEVRLQQGEQLRLLLLRGSPLQEPEGGHGHLIVFDDASVLNRAQREAAWAEVARRLAHEIKNPLTPIQLAAERLRRRYLGRLPADDSDILERATGTIISQVEALKHLVNAFADYARPSPPRRLRIGLNALVADVLALYQQDSRLQIRRALHAEEILLEADPDRLRQVLHNLIKNAIEASDQAGGLIRLDVGTAVVQLDPESDAQTALIQIRDYGQGLPADFDLAATEPYRSDKPRGSGLGLVIVRRIIAEHGGRLEATDADGGGARFSLLLPV